MQDELPAKAAPLKTAEPESKTEKAGSETSSEGDQPLPDSLKRKKETSVPENEEEEDGDDIANEEEDENEDGLDDSARNDIDEENGDSSPKDETESVARSNKVEQPYSTRGRHKEEEPLEALERKPRDNLTGVLGQGEDDLEPVAIATASTSFLESLSEEDRRTRTRHLPDVPGFHELHKAEVKNDLALARSVVSNTGVTSTLSSSRRPKGKKSSGAQSREEDRMDVDDEEGTGPSEDERASDIVRLGGPIIDLDNKEFLVPSSVFVAPTDAGTSWNGDVDGSDGPAPVSSLKRLKQQPRSPRAVEGLAAFNPPRLPESIGAKKKHRMLRWERRPQDVEVDLANYKKTVQHTRGELRSAESERQRIQMVGSILRLHYMEQLQLLNEESIRLNDELGSIQTECVSAADLLTSRTRSRGAGKGSYLMKDVISIMKARGTELAEKGVPATFSGETGNYVPGFGGISAFGFIDWDKETAVPTEILANGWSLPGDKVTTPYGDGIILHVFGPSVLNVDEPSPAGLRPKQSSTPANSDKEVSPDVSSSTEKVPDVSHGFGTTGESSDVVMGKETTSNDADADADAPDDVAPDPGVVKSSEVPSASEPEANEENDPGPAGVSGSTLEKSTGNEKAGKDYQMSEILSPRVCVKLSFGLGYFPVDLVTSKESPSYYSDAMLAARWKKMVETAVLVGSSADVAGMERVSVVDQYDTNESSMDIDEMGAEAEKEDAIITTMEKAEGNADLPARDSIEDGEDGLSSRRFIPFGASLLPTAAGRGDLLAEAPITSLETQINADVLNSGGVLGMVSVHSYLHVI